MVTLRSNEIRIAVNGALGRMGQAVIQRATQMPGVVVTTLFERPDHPALGTMDHLSGQLVSAVQRPQAVDAVIDFTSPPALKQLLKCWDISNSALVSGTTGIDDETRELLSDLGKRVPVLWAPNMSLGVTVLQKLVYDAATLLGDDFDIEIVEAHHRHKVDAPSGTALALAQAATRARSQLRIVTGRSGQCGPRDKNEIGLLAVRGGDIVGEHEVYFAGPDESLRLKHIASNRGVFASGALRLAKWLVTRPAGLYGTSDWAGDISGTATI